MVRSDAVSHEGSLPSRRYAHLRDYDYSQSGFYFLTICVEDRRCSLGKIVDGTMRLSPAGAVVRSEWEGLPRRFPGVELDAWVVMPSHVHGILWLPGETTPDVLEIARAFKAVCTTRIRKRLLPSFAWQRGVYDRVIRNERDLNAIREYITNNPLQWHLDRENPDRLR